MYPSKSDLRRNPDLPAPSFAPDYDVEDGAKEDARAELKALDAFNEELDELASEHHNADCPEANKLVALAWWFTERAIRELRGTCSAGCSGTHPKKWCCCCAHFNELSNLANAIKGRL